MPPNDETIPALPVTPADMHLIAYRLRLLEVAVLESIASLKAEKVAQNIRMDGQSDRINEVEKAIIRINERMTLWQFTQLGFASLAAGFSGLAAWLLKR